jgi:hypothetical protein
MRKSMSSTRSGFLVELGGAPCRKSALGCFAPPPTHHGALDKSRVLRSILSPPAPSGDVSVCAPRASVQASLGYHTYTDQAV